MKILFRLMAVLFLVGAGFALGAQEAAADSTGIPLSLSEKKVADLTVGDFKLLADARSIEMQKRHYVGSAAAASFLIPGLGQFKTGDYVGGTLHLAGQVALVAGTMYGAWALLPSEIRKGDLSRSERHDLIQEYHDNGKEDELFASGAVMTGGIILSVIHSVWAASDARHQAIENINSGKVTFEPSLYVGHHGMGPSIKMSW